MQIPRSSPTQSANYAKFAHFVNLYYVSGTCPGREPWKIPANYADSARFAHTVRESREFRTLRTIIKTYVIDFQISDHRQRTQEKWSKSTGFRTVHLQPPRITRNSLNPHHNKQTRSPSRELPETYSECRKFCTFRTMHGQITQNSQHLP